MFTASQMKKPLGFTMQLVPTHIGDFQVVAYGAENIYPREIRLILDENNLAPEVLTKQAQLLYGQEPAIIKRQVLSLLL